jgi:hypothetical protein
MAIEDPRMYAATENKEQTVRGGISSGDTGWLMVAVPYCGTWTSWALWCFGTKYGGDKRCGSGLMRQLWCLYGRPEMDNSWP